jgi:hypothetical protein
VPLEIVKTKPPATHADKVYKFILFGFLCATAATLLLYMGTYTDGVERTVYTVIIASVVFLSSLWGIIATAKRKFKAKNGFLYIDTVFTCKQIAYSRIKYVVLHPTGAKILVHFNDKSKGLLIEFTDPNYYELVRTMRDTGKLVYGRGEFLF